MAWVKLDDHFVDHPKVLAAGPLAGFLYVAGLCYANRFLTDGFIPLEQVTRLLPKNGHGSAQLSDRLCKAGLWQSATRNDVSGFQIHDFLKYQPSKRRVLRDRKHTAKRQAKWRADHATRD
jgi:hypothetical protein